MKGMLSDGVCMEETVGEEVSLIKLGEATEKEDDDEALDENRTGEERLFEDMRPEALYLRDVHKKGLQLLTAEEEWVLAEKMKAGDTKSRDILIEKNLRFVIKIAKKYLDRGLPFLDLVAEGNVGLIKAIDRFKAEKGCRVSTYASQWIRQAIERALADHSHTIRIPNHIFEFLGRRWRIIRELESELGSTPNIEEIALRMDRENKERSGEELTAQSYKEDLPALLDRLHHAEEVVKIEKMVSIDTLLLAESDGILGDLILIDQRDSPEVVICRQEIAFAIIPNAMEVLSESERMVVSLRYGMNEEDREMKLGEIGDLRRVTRERIRQIEAKALKKMRLHIMSERDRTTRMRASCRT